MTALRDLPEEWDRLAAETARNAQLFEHTDRYVLALGRGRARQLEECAADLRAALAKEAEQS